jgi:hypothetical protein
VQSGEVVHSLPSKKQKAIDDMTYHVLENGQGMANYEISKAQQRPIFYNWLMSILLLA